MTSRTDGSNEGIEVSDVTDAEPAGEWLIYRGAGEPHTASTRCRNRRPGGTSTAGRWSAGPGPDSSSARRLGAYRHMAELHRPGPEELEMVNAALYLRRPLLVTGSPGTGKSTLAHAVAYELGLGRVLRWPIVSRSALAGRPLPLRRDRPAPGHPDRRAGLRRRRAAGPAASAATSGSARSAPRCCPPHARGCCSSTSSTRATSTCPTTC